MCLKFLTNVFTELAVHAHNATETQITNGLLKIQNGFYSDIYSSCFRKVDCIWMPRMLGDFSEIPCSLQVIWTLWWHVTNMIEIHRSVTAGSVYARYWSFRTHNFLKIIYTSEVTHIATAFIYFVSGKCTAYCCSEWWFERGEIPCWWRNWYQHYRWTWGGYKTLAIEGCWCVFEVPRHPSQCMSTWCQTLAEVCIVSQDVPRSLLFCLEEFLAVYLVWWNG